MAREEARGDARRRHKAPEVPAKDDRRPAPDPSPAGSDDDSVAPGDPDDAHVAGGDQTDLRRRDDFARGADEQAEFREQFDEDLYTDREDRPAQGNTADVAMEHRFGSDAEAYAEYAWRRPGDHHRGDESAVGQARDPSDIADEDESS